MKRFRPLYPSDLKLFEKPFNALPEDLMPLFKEALGPLTWDEIPPGLRQKAIKRWDNEHDPAKKISAEEWDDFFRRKETKKKEITEWKNIAAPTASDLALKKQKLLELTDELTKLEVWQEEMLGDELPPHMMATDHKNPPAHQETIIRTFRVLVNEDMNKKWWTSRMRDAKRNGLDECRIGTGKMGPGGSMWRPDMIGGWLVNRKSKGRDGLDSDAARNALKKFPGYEDIADQMFPSEE